MNKSLLAIFLISALSGFTQSKVQTTSAGNSFQSAFNQAYQSYPSIPRGILESFSWNNTRMTVLSANELQSCTGMPQALGIMGLFEDGKNYFHENLKLVALLSGYSISSIKQSPQTEIMAFASAYNTLMNQAPIDIKTKSSKTNFNIDLHAYVLTQLSEIPDSGRVNDYAKNSQLYQYLTFLKNPLHQSAYNFPAYQFSLSNFFGANYSILSSAKVIFSDHGIIDEHGHSYSFKQANTRSADYGPALWNPAASCNYSSRSGTAISAITIHTVQGTYAGCISWFQNCSASVSAHYVVRSSDGQVTQMVLESNKAWHVGSENPYTIGYEHEGYVSNPAWYTTAMYNASAGISRDVCNSGYGINPKRTYSGLASSGTNTLGNCIKIKGHQHYANQSHTDPGINWNWELYYQLINNNPTQTTITSTTGNFYDSGGSTGNYSDDERYLTLFSIPGATSITLNFTSFNLENNWDFMYIYDGNSLAAPLIGVYTGTNSPGSISSTGGNLLVEFRSDCSTTASGWAANWTSNATPPPPSDNVPPTTLVSVPNTWVTQNFTATFTDADNSGGSGLEKRYYQVIDYDGIDWRANASKGFFSDNFDLPSIHADWFSVTGNWAINSGYLEQNDESNGNTNIYTFINHSLSNRYLYHWAGKIEGAGTNRRAGLHYFADNPSLPNRGNGYFVWFRLDTDKIQLYKVTNDVFNLEDEVVYDFNVSQWYDFKVIYDRISGKHFVYVDNVLAQTWTDASPYSSGDYVSFRSGNSKYTVNNLKIYRSRNATATISVGPTGDLRYQNTNPTTPAGRVKSIVADSSGNLSAIHYVDVNVDWTVPDVIANVNDGVASDIDTFYNNTELNANWSSSYDQHSDVARYWYAVGTSPGASDVIPFTDNFWYDTVRVTGLNLNYGTTYYFTVKAENGAGLQSVVATSDGQLLLTPTQAPQAGFVSGNSLICVGDSIPFQNNSSNATTYSWTFSGGSPSSSNLSSPQVSFTTSGTYSVTLIANGPGGTDTLQQNISVTVSQPNSSQFMVSDTLVYLPSALVGFTNNSQNSNGYSWNFGDGTTSNTVSPWHQYLSAGIYNVQLVAINDACPSDTSSRLIYVYNGNGIDETNIEFDFAIISQTDNTIQLQVTSNKNQAGGIRLLDNIGKEVTYISKTFTQGNTILTIPTTQLSDGIYFISLVIDGQINLTKKCFIQH